MLYKCSTLYSKCFSRVFYSSLQLFRYATDFSTSTKMLRNYVYSLIAAGVTYVMGQNVGGCQVPRSGKRDSQKSGATAAGASSKERKEVGRQQLDRMYGPRGGGGGGVNFSGANKGLFLGLLTLVAAIVVVIIFVVVKDDVDFAPDTLFWVTSGTLAIILSAGTLLGCAGLYQVRKLYRNGDELSTLDAMLATVSGAGVVVYAVFGVMVGAASAVAATGPAAGGPEQRADIMLAAVSALQLVHVAVQSSLTAEGYRRSSWSRHQLFTKPGRQVSGAESVFYGGRTISDFRSKYLNPIYHVQSSEITISFSVQVSKNQNLYEQSVLLQKIVLYKYSKIKIFVAKVSIL